MGGFTFCGKISDSTVVTSDLAVANRTCCANATACKNYTSDTKNWNCSTSYSDKVYA